MDLVKMSGNTPELIQSIEVYWDYLKSTEKIYWMEVEYEFVYLDSALSFCL
jgi:hypothetical protein